jgi:hypothetical protein
MSQLLRTMPKLAADYTVGQAAAARAINKRRAYDRDFESIKCPFRNQLLTKSLSHINHRKSTQPMTTNLTAELRQYLTILIRALTVTISRALTVTISITNIIHVLTPWSLQSSLPYVSLHPSTKYNGDPTASTSNSCYIPTSTNCSPVSPSPSQLHCFNGDRFFIFTMATTSLQFIIVGYFYNPIHVQVI